MKLWLRFLALLNVGNARRRLGAIQGWERRKAKDRLLVGEGVADQKLSELSVVAEVQK